MDVPRLRVASLRYARDERNFGAPRVRARFPTTNVALFVATLASTLWAGFLFSPAAAHAVSLEELLRLVARTPDLLLEGLPFALSLVGILFTHEMGHYVLARRWRVDTTLPYFIPVPFGVGTLGAVIRMRSALPSRRATLDIGASGPLAGFVVAVPLLLWALASSRVVEVPAVHSASSPFEAVRFWLAGRPVFGPDTGVFHLGNSLLTWAAQRLVVGPLPPGMDVELHPVGIAATLGLLVTALNLVPVGQLDGGHVTYALLGRRRAFLVARIVSWTLLAAGLFVSWNWLVWWVLVRFIVGPRHPPALEEEALGSGRSVVAIISLVIFALTFVPVPVSL
jgi:membrane-associated protease RseP (regulator of RpoE activity)